MAPCRSWVRSARARLVALARRAGSPEATVGAALSFGSTLDEQSFVLGPALVGPASVLARPAYAIGGAAALVATCGTAFALHPTASAATPEDPGPAHGHDTDPAKSPTRAPARAALPAAPARMPGRVHAPRAALALRRAMLGACQSGITALTARLGQEDQAGLVYAAMGGRAPGPGSPWPPYPPASGRRRTGGWPRRPRASCRCRCRCGARAACLVSTPWSPCSASPTRRI
ncbi:hypothetical protein ACQ4WX_36845 [Streptomyces lasalocidi]